MGITNVGSRNYTDDIQRIDSEKQAKLPTGTKDQILKYAEDGSIVSSSNINEIIIGNYKVSHNATTDTLDIEYVGA